MRQPFRMLPIWCGAALCLLISSAPAQAQSSGRGSLGGYGGSVSSADPGMGMNGGTIIPYGGSFGGFMPFRMGGAGSLSSRTLTAPDMDPPRPSFGLSPMTGGMSSMSGRGNGSSLGGARMGGMPRTTGTGMGVMPPSFGYPFRQPPSLLGPSSTGLGMSM